MTLLDKLADVAQPVVAPLCLDPLMARIAEQAGFSAGYISGGALGYSYAVSEALLSMTEIGEVTRRITQRCDLDIIVDVGVGFGDAVHAARAVWELEQAGAAGIELEDQVAPKRVSHHRGIEHLIGMQPMQEKIHEAASARSSSDFVIIARTGAVKNESFRAAMERLRAYQEAGADVLMLMPESDEQVAAARQSLDAPLATITSMDNANKPRWRDSGWNLIIDPFTAQVLSVQAVQNAYTSYTRDGHSGADLKQLFETYDTLDEMAGFAELYAIEDRTTERTD